MQWSVPQKREIKEEKPRTRTNVIKWYFAEEMQLNHNKSNTVYVPYVTVPATVVLLICQVINLFIT